MKIEFSSQRREMLLFLPTNIAAVTSCANQQSRHQRIKNNYLIYCLIHMLYSYCLFSNPP